MKAKSLQRARAVSRPSIGRRQEAKGSRQKIGNAAGTAQPNLSELLNEGPRAHAQGQMQRMLQTSPRLSTRSAPGGARGEPGEVVQPKLTIGPVDDPYEREADRMAKEVVREIHAPAPSAEPSAVQRMDLEEDDEMRRKPHPEAVQRCVGGTKEEEKVQGKTLVQRRTGDGDMAAPADLEDSIQQARGGGKALPGELRSSMEQAFGADFGGVRVHTNSRANQLSSSIQARAFTTQRDIFLGAGEYDPGSRSGQELLAHELTHVVQQTGGD